MASVDYTFDGTGAGTGAGTLTTKVGTFARTSGVLGCSAAPALCVENTTTFAGDVEVSVTVTTPVAVVSCWARYTDTITGYALSVSATGLNLIKISGGSTVATYEALTGLTIVANDVITLRVVGTTNPILSAFINGVQQGASHTDTGGYSSGVIGCSLNATSDSLTRLQAADYVAPTATGAMVQHLRNLGAY